MDHAQRVLARERDLVPAARVQGPSDAVHPKRKTLFQRRFFFMRRDIGGAVARARGRLVAGEVGPLAFARKDAFLVFVEDVPKPELAVAAQIQRPAADAADGHPDVFQLTARLEVHIRRPARGQRMHPLRVQLLVRRHETGEVRRLERPRHDGPGGERSGENGQAAQDQELAARHRRRAAAAVRAAVIGIRHGDVDKPSMSFRAGRGGNG